MGRRGECECGGEWGGEESECGGEWGGEESVSVEVSGDSLTEPDSHKKRDVRGAWVVVKSLLLQPIS